MSFEYKNIVYANVEDAQAVIDRMAELCNVSHYVTVAEMYELSGVSCNDDEYSKHGWNTMNGAKVVSRNDGFIISMPLRARLLDEMEDTRKKYVEPLYRAKKSDNVNHPAHYMSHTGLETIDVIEAFTSDLTGMDAVCTANVIKYICRWKHKNGVEDLKKAQWYLNRLIEDNKPIERKSN